MEEVEVSGGSAGMLADMALLSCDLCAVLWPVQEVWLEWPHNLCVSILQALAEVKACLAYTECPRRNVPDFGRVFLMLKYADIT
jgi:hypothetical protein